MSRLSFEPEFYGGYFIGIFSLDKWWDQTAIEDNRASRISMSWNWSSEKDESNGAIFISVR